MAFPIVSASASSPGLTGTAQAATLPAHSAGQRLLVFMAVDGGLTAYSSHTSGWTLLANVDQTTCSLLVFERIATGSAEALTINLSASRATRHVSYAISGTDTAVAASVATSTSGSGGTATPNSPSLAAPWGSDDNLWFTAFAQDNASVTLTAFPTNYPDNRLDNNGGTTSTPRIGVASRNLIAASEDPDAFTLLSPEQWVAITVGIKPAAGAGGTDGTASGVTLSASASLIAGSASGAAAGQAPGVTLAATASLIAGSASGGASNNIRLQPSLDLERGAFAASRTISRWWVLSSDLSSIAHTGTAVTTNANGQPTIDINGAAYSVGDTVPMWFGEWTSEPNPFDRTVRSGLMWVPAIAQA